MSAMTGPRSPTSPWPQESQGLTLPGTSSPTTLFSLCDHRSPSFNSISPKGTGPDLSGSNYFSFNLDSQSSFAKHKDKLSHVQSSISRPAEHFIPGQSITEDHAAPSLARLENNTGSPAPPVKLSWNRGPEGRDPGFNRPKAAAGEITCCPVSAERCAELLKSSQHELILLDVRPFAHFSKGNIKQSLNLCIPTTLLKRPSFDTGKLANTFTDEADRQSFARWKQCRYIVVYDSGTVNMKDTAPLANVLKKFTAEGWNGEGLILMGGFKDFSTRFPDLTQQQMHGRENQLKNPSPVHIDLPGFAPIAGGCSLPDSSHATVPFFGNIRQNMDLVGGVGQIALKNSENLSEVKRQLLPPWLREASNPADKGRIVAAKFLEIEKTELGRMKQALSYDKNIDFTSVEPSPQIFRIAGIEKGTKNRYNDIYPYDHSRVKLQGVLPGACDYVNASYMKAEYSDKCYIATQAPVPDTFNDFWRVVWEQDIRLVVSLTAEVERGQVKCHPYWKSGAYGPFQVNNFSQKHIPIASPGSQGVNTESDNTLPSSIIVRHFGLSHSDFPFEPLREITQLQYPYWPDFGTTSQPMHLLKLVEQCDKIRAATSVTAGNPKGGSIVQRPVLVHCSAGCGRTGAFCTVDSVLDMLKQQRDQPLDLHDSQSSSRWAWNGHIDLVAKTVADFRTQRPSMVQNLSQFVLCYESVLEWAVSQMDSSPQ